MYYYPEQVVLGCIRDQTEQAIVSKTVSIFPMVCASISASRFYLEFLLWQPSVMNVTCMSKKPFPSQLFFVNNRTCTGRCLRPRLLSLHMVSTHCWWLFGFIFNFINLKSWISVTITSTYFDLCIYQLNSITEFFFPNKKGWLQNFPSLYKLGMPSDAFILEQ